MMVAKVDSIPVPVVTKIKFFENCFSRYIGYLGEKRVSAVRDGRFDRGLVRDTAHGPRFLLRRKSSSEDNGNVRCGQRCRLRHEGPGGYNRRYPERIEESVSPEAWETSAVQAENPNQPCE